MLDVFRARTAWDSFSTQSLLLLSFPLNVLVYDSVIVRAAHMLLNFNHNVE